MSFYATHTARAEDAEVAAVAMVTGANGNVAYARQLEQENGLEESSKTGDEGADVIEIAVTEFDEEMRSQIEADIEKLILTEEAVSGDVTSEDVKGKHEDEEPSEEQEAAVIAEDAVDASTAAEGRLLLGRRPCCHRQLIAITVACSRHSET